MSLADLLFVTVAGDRTNWWNPDTSGTYTEKTARGRAYAITLINWMRLHDNPAPLKHVLREMNHADPSGVEIGFIWALAVFLTQNR
jgi:cell fate regulator YaaT (PSP1 superfamily)